MSILKVNSIQPFSGGSVKITGNSVISGSFSGSFEGSFDGNTGFEDITNKPTLISGSNQLAGTSVNGNLTINSELKILSSSLLYGQNTDIDGEEVVLSRATLSVALSGNNVNLQASGSINNWSIKTTSKLI